jgi:hypothetical protein
MALPSRPRFVSLFAWTTVPFLLFAGSEEATAAPAPVEEPHGTVTLTYGDETVKLEEFREMGTNLLFSAGTVSLSLVTSEGDKLSVGYLARDGAPETGEFAPLTPGVEQEKRMIQLSTMGVIGPDPGVRLSAGTVTVSRCDRSGAFVAEFSGTAKSLNPTVEGETPFSGTIDVKVPVIDR